MEAKREALFFVTRIVGETVVFIFFSHGKGGLGHVNFLAIESPIVYLEKSGGLYTD